MLNIKLNPELINIVLANMQTNLSKNEQAIYIYIKLCKFLTYDETFYVMNNKYEFAKYHEDINNLKNISLFNNKIVCYEFTLIYAKLLDMIDIEYEIHDYSKTKDQKGHTNLLLKIDDYKIKADAVTSILMGDLTNAKINYPLKGLVCKNKPSEFQEHISKIYTNQKIETKEGIIKEYNITNNSLLTRFNILLDKVKKNNLATIDSYSYLLLLRDILFDYGEKRDNFRISIIKNNSILKPIMILSLNEYDFENVEDETEYYLFDSQFLTKISIEELRSKFINNEYEYFENDLPRIPNINTKIYKK